MIKISRKRKRQWIGFAFGLFASAVAYTLLGMKSNEKMLALGKMNTGHEELSCSSCHTPAKGNIFQQLQANFMYKVGMRRTPVSFGTEDVDTKKCLECHDRENDRHPLHRFAEPRFAKARENLGVTRCESCHMEHNGVRVTQTNIGYCQNCHQDTELKNDPLDVSHQELISKKMWTTCLQCHDFHGNHIYDAAVSVKDSIPLRLIREYFDGGKSPYSDKKVYYPLKEEEWSKKKHY